MDRVSTSVERRKVISSYLTDIQKFLSELNLFLSVEAQVQALHCPSSVTEGSNVNLQCNATGNPSPNITWIWQDTGIVLGSNDHLIMLDVHRRHTGIYQCHAWNGIGNSSISTCYLDVFCKSINFNVKVDGMQTPYQIAWVSSTLCCRVWEEESEYLLVGVSGRSQRGGLTDTTALGAARKGNTVSDPATNRHQALLEKQEEIVFSFVKRSNQLRWPYYLSVSLGKIFSRLDSNFRTTCPHWVIYRYPYR